MIIARQMPSVDYQSASSKAQISIFTDEKLPQDSNSYWKLLKYNEQIIEWKIARPV